MITEAVVAILFAILALAIVAWIAIIIPEFEKFLNYHKMLSSILAFIFNAAPVQQDSKKAPRPIRVVIQRLIPIILWLIILVPMFLFPIILIIFPILHIPWSYLLPPTP
ncbi:MAG: hypothetical protein OK457_10030 [Thaumarchaeota archaeon]|nr:hypothetical protein [Nitrososphaerota archaeon]